MVNPGVIKFQNIPIPEPKPYEVLVKMMRIGICGSDIHVYHGKHPYTSYPVTQGHEVSGSIEKIGSGVDNFSVGDKVTIQPQVTCGSCYSCRNDQYHICDELKVMGFQTTGMASEYFVVDQSKLIKLPSEMSFEEGAMIEPVAVACHAISRVDAISGKKVIVLGAGPIGNLTAQVARAQGAEAVLITDISDYRLSLAKKVGIEYIVNPEKTNLSEQIDENFGNDRADVIFECVGSEQTINEAILNARKGTEIVVVGVFGMKPEVDIGLIQDRELRIIGTLMYQRRDYLKAIELIQSVKIKLEPLMTKHFLFVEYEQAYQFIESNQDKAMKVFIDINEP